MKNKYVRRSKISEAKFRNIIKYFALELDARKIAALTGLNRNTVNRYLTRVRDRIVALCEDQARQTRTGTDRTLQSPENGNGVRPKGKIDDSLPVFGIQSWNTHIYTEILPNGIRPKLRRVMQDGKIQAPLKLPNSWRHYDGIVDLNGRWHYRFRPLYTGTTSEDGIHNRIEEFLGFARKRLTTINLNGNDHFNLHLKECEFRFNHRSDDLYQLLLKHLRENPIS